MKKLFTLIALLGMCVSGAWADVVEYTSTESAYIDATNDETKSATHDGATSEFLSLYYCQFRNWGSNDGQLKYNASARTAFFKFDLSALKTLAAEKNITSIVFQYTVTGTGDGNSCTGILPLGYNGDWSANTLTFNNAPNAIGTITGLVTSTGSFQPLANANTEASGNSFPKVLNKDATTYVKSAISEDKSSVSFSFANNTMREAKLAVTAKLIVTYLDVQTYTATFTENASLNPSIKIFSDSERSVEVANGTLLDATTYYYRATLTGYKDFEGQFTVDGANPSVNFTMVAKQTYNYTVNAQINGETYEVLGSGSAFENDNASYYWKCYINNNGNLWTKGAVSSSYKGSAAIDVQNKEINLTYSSTTISNVVFLAEGEDLFTVGTGSAADTRCSMGKGGYASSKTSFATLPAGKYILTASNRCSGDKTAMHKFYKGDDVEPFFSANGNGYNATRVSDEFTLTEETTLYMLGGDNNNYVDYLYIVKTGEVCTVSAAGYATYSAPFALDLDNLTAGYTAYVATASTGETVTIEPATGIVPANTGLIIKGAEGTCEIPVSAEAGNAPATNYLVAVTANNTSIAYEANVSKYVLGVDNQEVKFLQIVEGTPAILNAGKSYLKIESTPAKALRFVVGGTTGIENVASAKATNKAVKRIMNGQLVIEKAGKMFNAAGAQVK